MQTVTIIDYGMSNLRSVERALQFVAGQSHRIVVSDKPEEIAAADRVVFPGQGAIGQCMHMLRGHGLIDVLRECLRTKPFLGICLGLQSLMDWSDEDGGVACLGVLPGRVVRFPLDLNANGERLKVPHMGWNKVEQTAAHALWNGIAHGERFYFVHSYYVAPESSADIAATTEYGVNFTSACARANVFATQFHPEKSQKAGLTLLANFLRWNGS
ncbi:MAG: imidazole glycerol phosphate synthase subunit HisH [Gammaproteobacteria bacterium]